MLATSRPATGCWGQRRGVPAIGPCPARRVRARVASRDARPSSPERSPSLASHDFDRLGDLAVQRVMGRTATAPPPATVARAASPDVQRTLRRSPSPGADSEEDTENNDECPVFIDPQDGHITELMCCDFGYRTGAARVINGYGEIPKPAWQMAAANFTAEWAQLRRSFRYDQYRQVAQLNPATGLFGKVVYALGSGVVRLFSAIDQKLEDSQLFGALLPNPEVAGAIDRSTGSLSKECARIRVNLRQLALSNDAVWARERAREAAGFGVDTPWYVKAVYYPLCVFLDVAYNNRPLQRFWFLETVARMPYFSYIVMLHLYETLGWHRAGAELRKVHFAEEWNELHHLQIMESLGGDQLWVDRFMAQHAAFAYFLILCALFVASPATAYNFSELIEAHAYYRGEDLYMFDHFQTSQRGVPRRPRCDSLYDVFINIRDDEGEHVATMAACQDMSIAEQLEARQAGTPDAPQASIWD